MERFKIETEIHIDGQPFTDSYETNTTPQAEMLIINATAKDYKGKIKRVLMESIDCQFLLGGSVVGYSCII